MQSPKSMSSRSSTSDEEESVSPRVEQIASPRSQDTTPRDSGADTTSPRGSGLKSPKKQGKKKMVRRKRKGGTARRQSRSRASSAGDYEDAAEATSNEHQSRSRSASTAADTSVPKTHVAHVCPDCKKKCADAQELTRHLESHSDAPFPGVKVRHRNSVLLSAAEAPKLGPQKPAAKPSEPSAAANNNTTTTTTAPIRLPPLSQYLTAAYFNWGPERRE